MAILLTGCLNPPAPEHALNVASFNFSDPPIFPTPPIKPSVGSEPPRDLRSFVLEGLQLSGQSLTIGESVLGQPIEAYRFGSGATGIVLVGGIHGGSEANTVRLAMEFITLFQRSADLIPSAVSLYIIPNMNPDGYAQAGIEGRVNANGVDLNRNWDCRWQKNSGLYKGAAYHTGTRAFSEPESRAVRNFVDYVGAETVVFYHSHGGFIFYGDCNGNSGSRELARAVRAATEYPIWNPAHSLGDPNQPQITGDATDYFDRNGIASIGIELTTTDATNIDWELSQSGLLAILAYVSGLD